MNGRAQLYRDGVNERKYFTSASDKRSRVYHCLRNAHYWAHLPNPGTQNVAYAKLVPLRSFRRHRNLVNASVASYPAVSVIISPLRMSQLQTTGRQVDVRFLYDSLSPLRQRAIAKCSGGRAFFVRDAGEIVATLRRRVHRPRVRKSTAHRI